MATDRKPSRHGVYGTRNMSAKVSGKTNALQPAYVLHSYDWSESSLIVELFTAAAGRVAVVARGAKKPGSGFRPILLPLQPLLVRFRNYSQELAVLQSARWAGGKVMPAGARGERLLAGYYANELLLRLLPRQDSCPALFAAYAQLTELLHSSWESAALIRSFELFALQQQGYLPALNTQYNGETLQHGKRYSLQPQLGLCLSNEAGCDLSAETWQLLHQALSHADAFQACLRLTGSWSHEQQTALRKALHPSIQQHSGRAQLRTRQLIMDMMEL